MVTLSLLNRESLLNQDLIVHVYIALYSTWYRRNFKVMDSGSGSKEYIESKDWIMSMWKVFFLTISQQLIHFKNIHFYVVKGSPIADSETTLMSSLPCWGTMAVISMSSDTSCRILPRINEDQLWNFCKEKQDH